ncbi:Chitinase A precursor [Anaerohalosphaera lusitana]|uniref:Chitinase A n=1 Tax=Anaerohalosphaera lusitana TaxID=1936003 RepID=A0A1U9NPL1_9BACT|nr:LamG-like jellyroll fold domain-containing protein [Anaerohalosphaera lusitana]AQT69446.1 Chitinase A precursor [Anaerohalosphaera lusitana]
MTSKGKKDSLGRIQNNNGLSRLCMRSLLMCVFFLFAGAAMAGTYYVDPASGSDGNPGTSSAPWQSFSKAQNSVGAGDTVILEGGYYGSVSYSGSDARGSSWASPVTYKAAEGATPKFGKLVFQSGASDLYAVFDGITVYPSGVYMDHIVSGVKLLNMTIGGKWSSYGPSLTSNGICMEGTFGTTDFHEIYIDNCEVTDVHTGIKLEGQLGKNIVISNNEIHHIAGSGIKISADKGNEVVRIEGNHIHNQDPVDEGSSGITHGTGISIRNDNLIVRGNIIHQFGNTRGIRTYQDIFPSRGYRNMVFENNLLYDVHNVYVVEFVDMGDDFVFSNNTVIGSEFGRGGNKWYETALRVVWPGGVDGSRLTMNNNVFVGLVSIGGQIYNAEANNNYMYALNGGDMSFGSNVVVNGTSGHSTYFEGSGNFFVGGELFDKYSYTRPGGHPHGVNLNECYALADPSLKTGYEFGGSGPKLADIGDKSVNENETLTFSVSATHPDGEPLTYSAQDMPEGAAFTDQQFSWTPTFGQAGSYSVSFTATDGVMSDSKTITITVNPVDEDSDGLADYWEMEHFGNLDSGPDDNPDGDEFNNLQEYEEGLDPNVFDEGPLNLVLDYRFNDDPADGVKDSSRYHNDGTTLDSSTPALVTSDSYTAYDFDGVDDFVNAGTDASLNTAQSLTISGWMFPRTYGQSGYGRIVDKGDGTTGYSVFVNQETRALSYVTYGGMVVSSESGSLTLDQWHHFAVVYDDAASTLTFYIDGVQRGRTSYSSAPGDSAASPMIVGTRGYDLARCFDGAIDDLKIYNEALSEAKVVELASPEENRAPVLSAIGDKSVEESNLLTFGVTASDPDGDQVLIKATNVPTGAEFADDTFSWTPDSSQVGSHDVSFYATDGELQDSETVTITVLSGNSAPVMEDTPDKSVEEGSLLEFAVSATDPDGDSISYSAQNLPTGADFAGDTFSWTPEVGQAGTYLTSFVASDGELEDVDTVSITVVETTTGGNTSPVFDPVADQSTSINETVDFTVNASDADGDLLSYSAENMPAGAEFIRNHFVWTPSSEQVGDYSVIFNVTDGTATDTMTVNIHVNAPLLTRGLVGLWKFNEGSGSTAGDTSTKVNHGTLTNGAAWTTGVSGSGISFDGVDDYVAVDDSASLNLTGSLSVAAWIKPNSFGSRGYGRILDKGASSVGYSFFVNHKFGGLSFATYGGPVADSNDNVVTTGKWQHVAMVYDQAAETVTFYVDGVSAGTASYNKAPSDSAGSPLTIGIRGQDMERAFDGIIDEVHLYDFAVSESDIQTLAEPGNSEPTNTAPAVTDVADQTVKAGQNLEFVVEASDADGDALTYSSPNLPTGAVLTNNVFSWTPESTQVGSYTVDFIVSDGTDLVSTTVDITVTESTDGRGLAAVWKFDEGSGEIANDSSAMNNDAILGNGAVWTTGVNGSAVSFDGVDDYVAANDSASLNLTGSLSVAAWIKPNSFGSRGYGRILDKGANSAGYSFFVNHKFGGLSFATYGGPVADSNDNVITTGKWQHVAMVYDQAAETVTFYVDGVRAGMVSHKSVPNDSSRSPLTIGIRGQDMERAFDGIIDEVHLYDYAVSESEVQVLAEPVITEPTNTAPYVTGIVDQTVEAGQNLEFAIEASDADGDALTYSSPNLPAGATLTDNVFSWTPESTQVGTYTVDFLVSDGVDAVTESCMITVNESTDSGSEVVIDSSTVMALDMDSEPVDGLVQDVSTYDNDGRIVGRPVVSDSAFEFDGLDDGVVVPDHASLDLDQMTVSAWVYLDSYQDDQRIISKEYDKYAPYSIYSLLMSGSNESKVEFRIAVNGVRYRVASSQDIPLNQWVHVAGTYDGGEMVVYVNGRRDGSYAVSGPIQDNDNGVYVGASQFYSRFFDGKIDSPMVYNKALSSSEIASMASQR